MGLLKINFFIALITVLLSAPLSVWGDEDAPVFHVQQVDPSFDSQKMAAPGVKVHRAEELDRGEWKIPKKKIRDDLFQQAGLNEHIKGWDEMDRDILFLTARDSTSQVLIKKYPKIPKEKLLELAKLTKVDSK